MTFVSDLHTAGPRYRDHTFYNGAVYTGGAHPRYVDCMVTRAGRVAWVGEHAQRPDALRGGATTDLRGRMVVPSFTDSHAHPVDGFQLTCDADLGGIQTFDGIRAAVQHCAQTHPQRTWVVAGNVVLEALGERLNREALDTMAPDRPLLLIGYDVHSGCLNTAALRLLGIDASTPDPEGGIYGRAANGEPNGLVHEAALYRLFPHLPQMSPVESAAALRKALQQAHRFGVTGWFDAMVGQRLVDAYQRADEAGELLAHVSLGLLVSPTLPLAAQIEKMKHWRASCSTDRVRAHTAKIFIDGVLESHTAALLAPYADAPHAGEAHWEPTQLREAVFAADAGGFDLHFHTVGDRAVRMALDALDALNRERGIRDRRAQLAHVQLINASDVPRFRETGAIASIQAVWANMEPALRQLYTSLLGDARMERQYVFAELQRAGAMLSGGSDWPVSTQNPLVAFESAMRRATLGDPRAAAFLPAQRVDLDTMLQAHTYHSAFSLRLDDALGTLTAGRPASFAVLEQDLRAVAPHEVAQVDVAMTVFEGKAVYGAVE
ncbi:amidohydrolase [Paraburkholderia kururiensis]|uniref:amidohydrolase n=1 Tax=Paraburkholderia kururiensis TaxID=984307 RepID=UPI0005AB475D|nr:amidohydrolase [Paraburkholderia kururiensis]